MTITDPAWRQTEPPDHDEPTLRDRLEEVPADELRAILSCLQDDYPEIVSHLEYYVSDWEQEQIAKVATP